MALPISIDAKPNPITDFTFLEEFDFDTGRKLLSSPELKSQWERDHWITKSASALYDNEHTQLQTYIGKYIPELGGVLVNYSKQKQKWGRPFVEKALGFTSMRKPVRHTLAVEKYYDIDMSNAQPVILFNICRANGIPVPPALSTYVFERDNVMKELAEGLSTTKDEIKTLFIRLIFFGTYEGMRMDQRQRGSEVFPVTPPPFIADFMKAVSYLVPVFRKHNKALEKYVYRNNNDDGHANKDGRFMALYLQEYEAKIMGAVIATLAKQYPELLKTEKESRYMSCVYEFDGLKLAKRNVDAYSGGVDGVINLVEDIVARLYQFAATFVVKPMDKGLNVEELPCSEVVTAALSPDAVDNIVQKLRTFTHEEAVNVLMSAKLTDRYIYMMPEKQWCCWNGTKWVFDDVCIYAAIRKEAKSYFLSMFTEDQAKKDKKLKEAWEKLQVKLGTHSWINGALNEATKRMVQYNTEWDLDTELLGFNNGVLDIRRKVFRPAVMEDKVTMTCGYDFELIPNFDDKERRIEDEINTRVLDRIFPDPAERDLWLTIAASGCTGCMENFIIQNGGGRNGKGLLNSALELLLGDYFYHCSYSVLTEDPRRKNSGNANPELANVDRKRMVVMREPPKDVPLSNNVIKDMTGGGTIKARQLYKDKTEVHLHCTVSLETNARPPLREEATYAEAERFIDQLYRSTFTSNKAKWNEKKFVFPLDPTLKERQWWKDRRLVFMNMIVRQLWKLRDNKYKLNDFVPQSVRDRSQEYLQGSFLAHRIFVQLYEKRKEDVTYRLDYDFSINQIVMAIQSCPQWYNLPPHVKNKPENSANSIKRFFKESEHYMEDVYKRSNNSYYLRDYREIEAEEEAQQLDDTSSEDFDIASEESLSVH